MRKSRRCKVFTRRGFRNRRDSDDEDEKEFMDSEKRQCFGLGCTNAARSLSKYCSEECGINLAKLRILAILPEKVKEWKKSKGIAEERSEKELEDIQQKQNKLREEFQQLEIKRVALDKLIESVALIECDPAESEEDSTSDDNFLIFCVYCGHETNAKNVSKHLERCFIAAEKETIYEAKLPAIVPGTKLVCDYFNKRTGNYCKKLDVLCPEHGLSKRSVQFREKTDKSVCGAPEELNSISLLHEDMMTTTFDVTKICKLPKRQCHRHFMWEKRERALIDHQKVLVVNQLNLVTAKEQNLRQAQLERGNVWNLLLNTTFSE